MQRSFSVYDQVVQYHDWGCRIVFPDGETVDATPHYTPHYYVISHRTGYGDDVMAYCREHEVAHIFVGHWLAGGRSHVLWELANHRDPDLKIAIQEEASAQLLQRWWRGNERPIIGDVDWDGLKSTALEILDN